MTPTETATILRQFNEWRRGDEDIPQFDVYKVGAAIDAAVEMIDRLDVAESECLEEARLNGMGSEREAALMAKMEAAEKTNREWLRANAPGGWIDNLRVENETLAANLRGKHRIAGATYTHLIAERDELRAKIEAMERQEPVAWMLNCPTLGGGTGWILSWTQSGAGLCNRLQGEENEKRLYALPCVQPESSVPDGWKESAIAWEVCASIHREYGNGKDPFFNTRQGDFVKHANDARAMLAAAPEAKP